MTQRQVNQTSTTTLSLARGDFPATTIGKKALFGGGGKIDDNSLIVNTVDFFCFDDVLGEVPAPYNSQSNSVPLPFVTMVTGDSGSLTASCNAYQTLLQSTVTLPSNVAMSLGLILGGAATVPAVSTFCPSA